MQNSQHIFALNIGIRGEVGLCRRWFSFLVAVTIAEALNVATPPLKVEQPLGRQRARSGRHLGSGLGEQVKVWVGSVGKDWGEKGNFRYQSLLESGKLIFQFEAATMIRNGCGLPFSLQLLFRACAFVKKEEVQFHCGYLAILQCINGLHTSN